MNYCNILITKKGVLEENILVIGDEKGNSTGVEAEKILVEKAKEYAPSGTVWDDDIENEMLVDGYIRFDDILVMISWPELKNTIN